MPPPPGGAAGSTRPAGTADAARREGGWARFRNLPVAAQIAVWAGLGLILVGLIVVLALLLGGGDDDADGGAAATTEPARDTTAANEPASNDLSGTWEGSLLIVRDVNALDDEETVNTVVLTCDEDGRCATETEDTIFEPRGDGRYDVTGTFLADCLDVDDGSLTAAAAYDVAREGEMEVTAEQDGRPTEVEGTWTEISTPNEVGEEAGCPRAEQDYEAMLVRSATEIVVPDPEPADAIAEFGSDEALDDLAEECEAGDLVSCDDLYDRSDLGSGYEAYGDGCGGRNPPADYCIVVYHGRWQPIDEEGPPEPGAG